MKKNKLEEDVIDSAKDSTDMAVTRTVMAVERSLMAWVRTGLALISFGFTIYKFLDYSREQLIATGELVSNISGPKVIGLFLIGMGVLSLLLGTIENEFAIRKLRENHDFSHSRYALFMALMLMAFGLGLIIAIIFRILGA